MIFFSVSPFGIRKFSNIVQISLEIVLHVCIFSIIWFQNLHISDDLEERKQQDKQLQCLVFCIFFIFRIFCISEFARKGPKRWKYGGHEASWPDVWEEYDSDCLAWASIAYYLSYAFCLHVIVIITTFNLIITIIFSTLIMSMAFHLIRSIWSLFIQF